MTSSVKDWLLLLARLIVGGVFLYASVSKILKPYHFAAAVQAYQLLPPALVGFTAVVIPWMEAVAAAALLLNWQPRSALLVLSGLMVVFLAAIAITMARGLNIDCGCGLLVERPVGWLALVEDGILLLLLLGLYAALLSLRPAQAEFSA
ncbi:MAG: MauE/DoxX family redox-associated membrane protein [Desulfobacca sp.]|uniref:MauE/DoxX family redox-associated membrane protein n=1 Tax=Desulfobacca sp. TaxID=2067990 RepID=UPI004049BDAD